MTDLEIEILTLKSQIACHEEEIRMLNDYVMDLKREYKKKCTCVPSHRSQISNKPLLINIY